MKKQQIRNSTLELLRILSMFMILGLHYIAPQIGGGLQTTVPANLLFLHVAESACIPAVNVFVLISGYFLCEKKTTGLRKAVELYLVMVVIDLALLLFGVLHGDCIFSFRALAISLVPFAFGQHWFLETYILLLLFLPFLNLLLERLSQSAHALLIGIQMLIFSLWPSFLPSSPLTDNGYGLTNFITVYLIAAYLRRHVHFRNQKASAVFGLLGWLFSVAIIAVSSYIPYLQSQAWRYCYLFAITASVGIFVFFLNLPAFFNRAVNLISSTVFDIYIAHAFVLLQPFVYEELMKIPKYRDSAFLPLHFILCVMLQFLVFSIMGLLRRMLWKPTAGRILSKSLILQREEAWEQSIL